MLQFIKHIWSYILGVKLKSYESTVSGQLELWLVDGKKVLNSKHANYSFDSLHVVFQRAFHEARLELIPKAEVLILGFGCGSVAHILQKEYRFDCTITGVDIDPLMFTLAKEHFGIKPSKKLQFIAADAATFISNFEMKYDLIVVDLFIDDIVPEQFSHPAFWNNCLRSLKTGGQFFMNFISEKSGKMQVENALDFFENKDGEYTIIHPLPSNTVIYFTLAK